MNSISSAPVPTPYARHGNVEKTAALLCCLLFSGLAFVLPTLVREARRDMHSLMEEKVHVSRGGVGASAWYEASNRNRTVRDGLDAITQVVSSTPKTAALLRQVGAVKAPRVVDAPRVIDQPTGENLVRRRRRITTAKSAALRGGSGARPSDRRVSPG